MHVPEDILIGSFPRVEIGNAVIADFSESHRVTLGSCVGLCLHWKKQEKYGLAHVLLPSSENAKDGEIDASRYADTVALHLLERLEVPRARYRQVDAYVAGGSNLYDARTQVGVQNATNLLASLQSLRIRVRKQDLGGDVSRQMAVVGPQRLVLTVLLDNTNATQGWPLRIAA